MRGSVVALIFVFLSIVLSCAQPQEPTLDVSPTAQTLVAGEGLQLTVTRTFSGDVARDITPKVDYATSNKNLATVDAKGVLTAVPEASQGTVLVRVHDPESDATGTATFTIVPSQIESIDVAPTAVALTKGMKRQLTATAHKTNGAVVDVTQQVLWTSTNELAATVGDTGMDKGLIETVADGETDIIATDAQTQVSGRTIVFVTGGESTPVLAAIIVGPNPGVVAVGKTVQMTATGVLTDGSTRDLTHDATWKSSRTDLATVDALGVVTGVAAGDATITAVGPEPTTSVLGSAALKVTP
ncbi:MAG TPA: Ig-like domain-containing protein [Labilithrix sp.]